MWGFSALASPKSNIIAGLIVEADDSSILYIFPNTVSFFGAAVGDFSAVMSLGYVFTQNNQWDNVNHAVVPGWNLQIGGVSFSSFDVSAGEWFGSSVTGDIDTDWAVFWTALYN